MRSIVNHKLLLVVILSLLFQACLKEEEVNEISEQQMEDVEAKPIVLGEELDIPYTTANMKLALNNLRVNMKGKSKNSKLSKIFKTDDEIEIVPSHYYYRFLPKDSVEHELIL